MLMWFCCFFLFAALKLFLNSPKEKKRKEKKNFLNAFLTLNYKGKPSSLVWTRLYSLNLSLIHDNLKQLLIVSDFIFGRTILLFSNFFIFSCLYPKLILNAFNWLELDSIFYFPRLGSLSVSFLCLAVGNKNAWCLIYSFTYHFIYNLSAHLYLLMNFLAYLNWIYDIDFSSQMYEPWFWFG